MGLADLFRPKWKHASVQVRLEAVERLNDPAVLAEVAASDDSLEVRLMALGAIQDETILAGIAGGGEAGTPGGAASWDEFLLLSALKGVNDEALLAGLALKASLSAVRLEAVEKINDPERLRDLADHAASGKVRQAAAVRIEDLQREEAREEAAPEGDPGPSLEEILKEMPSLRFESYPSMELEHSGKNFSLFQLLAKIESWDWEYESEPSPHLTLSHYEDLIRGHVNHSGLVVRTGENSYRASFSSKPHFYD